MTALRTELAAVERARRQLHSRVCATTAAITGREAARARDAHPNDPRVGERAVRETQRELADELGWTASEAKQHREAGEQLARSPQAAAAAADGELSPAHLTVLKRTLKPLWGRDRKSAEERLLAVAPTQDAVTFAGTAQRILADLDAGAAEQAAERRHQRRRGSVTTTTDGMTRVFGEWAGIQGEEVTTGIEAFRRPDAPDEYRTPEQRTADAIADMARAALTGGQPPTQHGVRPHVVVTVAAEDLKAHDAGETAGRHATVTFGSDRTELLASVRSYLDDANWSWIVVDPDGVPLEAGPETPYRTGDGQGSASRAVGGDDAVLHHPDRPPRNPPPTGPDPGG